MWWSGLRGWDGQRWQDCSTQGGEMNKNESLTPAQPPPDGVPAQLTPAQPPTDGVPRQATPAQPPTDGVPRQTTPTQTLPDGVPAQLTPAQPPTDGVPHTTTPTQPPPDGVPAQTTPTQLTQMEFQLKQLQLNYSQMKFPQLFSSMHLTSPSSLLLHA